MYRFCARLDRSSTLLARFLTASSSSPPIECCMAYAIWHDAQRGRVEVRGLFVFPLRRHACRRESLTAPVHSFRPSTLNQHVLGYPGNLNRGGPRQAATSLRMCRALAARPRDPRASLLFSLHFATTHPLVSRLGTSRRPPRQQHCSKAHFLIRRLAWHS